MNEFRPFYLGRYKILGELGRGAMGVVYKALDSALARVVAVKTIHIQDPNIALTQEDVIETFSQEAKIAGALTHPNITAIYDIGYDQGIHFFVMEFVEGLTVESAIEQSMQMLIIEKLKIIATIARTLHYAHKRNVIHRDIKPANVMILENSEPKIMDFGVAKLKGGPLLNKSQVGKIFGTPNYMSPEQIKGEDVDHQTDIFSLGVLAYEFITYKRPFLAVGLKELFHSIVDKAPPTLSSYDQSVPVELEKIILKALSKDKTERYAYSNQFADALELFIDQMETADAVSERVLITDEKQKVIKALKKNYMFFSDFEDSEIVEIFKLSSRDTFDAGRLIFKEGSAANKMFIIIEGAVRIFHKAQQGAEIEISVLKDGDCFGEMAIIDNSPRSASAVALKKTIVVAINEIVLRITHPALCVKLHKNLASIISEKLRKSDQKLHELIEREKREPGP